MFYNRLVLLERLFVVCDRSIAQPGRALRSGRRGRRFESCYSDQYMEIAGLSGDFYVQKNTDFIYCVLV